MFDAQLKKLEERSRFEPKACGPTYYYGVVLSWSSPIPSGSSNTIPNIDGPDPPSLCSMCFCSMTSWVGLLQRMDKFSDLKAALTASIEPTQLSSTYAFNIPGAQPGQSSSEIASRFQGGLCFECLKGKRCCALKGMADRMLKNIEELPPFTSGEAVVGEGNDAN